VAELEILQKFLKLWKSFGKHFAFPWECDILLWQKNRLCDKRGSQMADLSKISVVLPSLDPDEKLNAVIDGLLEYGFTDIVLVNDGSKPENLHYFTDAAQAHPEIHVLTHPENRGKGAALKTAFTWVLENRPDGLGVVTVDGDNQHHPEDTRACCQHMLESGRITLGCRDFTLPHVPPRSRFGNKTTSGVFKLFCGITLSDTQTGLRAFPQETLALMNTVSGDRFEYETNMLLAMKTNGLPFDEVKIRTVYIEENKSSHFHWLKDSWRIYKLILRHFFRYTLSSILCAGVDAGMFALFDHLLATSGAMVHDTVPYVLARVISSLLNFFVNQRLVFQSTEKTGRALLRYYALAVPQLLVQMVLTNGVFWLLHVGEKANGLRTLWYIIVMTVLYFISYAIQQRWVFASHKQKSDARKTK